MIQQMIFYAIAIVLASSIDCFATGLSYGCNKIKINTLSLLIIVSLSMLTLFFSMFVGNLLGDFLDLFVATLLGSILLIALGLSKIITQIIKTIIKKKQGISSTIQFKLFSLKFVINICGKPEDADFDGNKLISTIEAIFLGLALSLDNLAIGFGAGMGAITLGVILVASALEFAVAFLGLRLGICVGNYLTKKTKINLSWVSGILLLTIAISNIVFLV